MIKMTSRYRVVNLTTKEYFFPLGDNGIDSLLWAGGRNIALMYNLLKGEWKGHHIAVVGDYNTRVYENLVGTELYRLNAIELDEHFKHLDLKVMKEKFKLINTWREVQKGYFVNYDLNEFIDLSLRPKGEYGVVSPIALMMIGRMPKYNEYVGVNKMLCGRWELHKVGITLDKKEVEGMNEIKPMFEIKK